MKIVGAAVFLLGLVESIQGKGLRELAKARDLQSQCIELTDAAHLTTNVGGGSKNMWQSFTALNTGNLDRVELKISSPLINKPSPGMLRIYEGEGTGGALLSEQSVTFQYVHNTFQVFSLETKPSVNAGSKYTIQFDAPSIEVGWISYDNYNGYAGGRMNLVDYADLAFKTFVLDCSDPLQCDHIYNNKCLVYHAEAKTYDDAQASCSANGGNLVTAGDIAALTEINTHVVPACGYWVGLKAEADTTFATWESGDRYVYSAAHWVPCEPNNPGVENCVQVSCHSSLPNSRMNDLSCTTTSPYVCEHECLPGGEGCEVPARVCRAGSHEYNGRCYQHFPTTGAGFDDFRTHCQSLGGDVASIPDAGALNFVHNTVAGGQCYYAIGLKRDATNNFAWVNGDQSTFRYWAGGEPNDYFGPGSEPCTMVYCDQRMNDIGCSSGSLSHGYICEFPANF